MKTKKMLSVLLALLLALSLSAAALADDETPTYSWERVPTSPNGLQKGDVWFDFTGLLSGEETEAEKAAILARFNAGDWYADFDAAMVMVENADAELNGTYSRTQQPYIVCAKEVGVSWVPVSKSMAGVQVGDYYIDKAAYLQDAEQALYAYYAATAPEDATPAALAQLKTRTDELAEIYFNEYTVSYNPGGRLYRYQLSGMPAPYVRYLVDYSIGELMLIVVHALDVSIRQADAAAVAASPWVRVASSAEDAEAGGYYVDFDDTAALMAAFNMTESPSAQDLAVIRAGEWYADFSRGVATGKVVYPAALAGSDEDIVMWIPESEALFHMIKVKPASDPGDPGASDEPEQQRPGFLKRIVSFFLRLIELIKKLFK